MRHNLQNLLVRPPFYDALSGEFVPHTDPEERAHTLGRLAFGAYAKGESQGIQVAGRGLGYSRVYRPSWAPEVTATVYASNSGSLRRLVGLTLDAADGSRLQINDTSTHSGMSLTIEDAAHNLVRIAGLDERIPYARGIVTEAAEAFFNPRSL